MTVELPEQLARRLQLQMDRLAEIIERGLQQAGPTTADNWRDSIAFLARGPRPEEIIAFRPSATHRERSRELLDKNRGGTLAESERGELEEMSYLNQFMMLLQAEARKTLATAANA